MEFIPSLSAPSAYDPCMHACQDQGYRLTVHPMNLDRHVQKRLQIKRAKREHVDQTKIL